MKLIKNLPVYVLSGALIFVGVASASQAGAAWNSSEKRTISLLEKRITELEKAIGAQQIQSNQKVSVTIPYIVESLEEYGTNKICGSGKCRQLDSRGHASMMSAGNYRLHTCSITLKVDK
jgi:hypothetical protein